MTSKEGLAELERETQALRSRLEKARGRMLVPPEWCFKLARRKHRAGHYEHDYDARKISSSVTGITGDPP